MTRDPAFTTDVFDYLMGDGFVMRDDRPPAMLPYSPTDASIRQPPREVWTGIEDDVRELERMLR